MSRPVAVGLTILAGVAVLEAALIPGLALGGAAVLAPRLLPVLRRRLRPLLGAAVRRREAPRAADRPAGARPAPALGIKRAIAKTITFRIIVTTLDFTSNLVVIGELATAAGLSGFNLVAGPLFYFAHETAWNYFGPVGDTVDLPRLRPDAGPSSAPREAVTISVALAKTITFRTIATVVDFTATYVVVGDVVTAAGLSAFGFVLGPFVYLGHEKAWEHFGAPRAPAADATPVALLPAPA